MTRTSIALATCVTLTACANYAEMAATADIGPQPDKAQAEQIIRKYERGGLFSTEPDVLRITRGPSRGYVSKSPYAYFGWVVCADMLSYSRDKTCIDALPHVYVIRHGEVVAKYGTWTNAAYGIAANIPPSSPCAGQWRRLKPEQVAPNER
jgi:hypothetical protein